MAQIGHFLGVGRGRVNPDAPSPEVVSQLREFPYQAMTASIRGRSRDRKWDSQGGLLSDLFLRSLFLFTPNREHSSSQKKGFHPSLAW